MNARYQHELACYAAHALYDVFSGTFADTFADVFKYAARNLAFECSSNGKWRVVYNPKLLKAA